MGRIGQIPWNKGKKNVYSKETLEKMRQARIGKTASDKTKKKLSKMRKGKPKSKEWREKIGKSNVGKHNYSEETRRKIAENTIKGMGIDGIRQMAATKAGYKTWKEYQRALPKWKKYKQKVWSRTYKELRNNPPLPNFKKRGRCGVKGAYQIDHVISIHEGFSRGIEPETIGAYSNLSMIPWKTNRTKGTK